MPSGCSPPRICLKKLRQLKYEMTGPFHEKLDFRLLREVVQITVSFLLFGSGLLVLGAIFRKKVGLVHPCLALSPRADPIHWGCTPGLPYAKAQIHSTSSNCCYVHRSTCSRRKMFTMFTTVIHAGGLYRLCRDIVEFLAMLSLCVAIGKQLPRASASSTRPTSLMPQVASMMNSHEGLHPK
jgi:hypothetical protein